MADRTVSVRLQAQITDYMAKFTTAGKAAQDLAGKVSVASGKQSAAFQTLGRSAVIGGAAVEAGLAIAVKRFADFDAQMSQVKSLSHATAGDMLRLRNAALDMGAGIGFSAKQTAEAETELVKAGVGVSDILGGALHGALVLAAAGQTDVASATETAAIAMTQFKLAGKDVPHIADLLAAGADKALGSVADLSEALKSGGLVAAQFTLSIDDTVGTLAAFAQAGLLGERGGTTLRQMLLQLTAPSKMAADLMDQLKIHTYDASGAFVGITNLAGQLHNKLGPLTQAERDHALAVIFGAHAIQGANVLYEEGAKGLQKWIDEVNSSGFAALQAAGKMDNLEGDVSKLGAAFNNALIGTGSHANGVLRTMVQDATYVVEAYNDLPGPVQAGATALIAVGGAAVFSGGAMILLLPKIYQTRQAMAELGITGRGVAKTLGKGGLLVTAAIVATAAVTEIEQAIAGVSYNADKMSTSLITLARSGRVANELVKAFGPDLENLGDQLKLAGDTGVEVFGVRFHNTISHMGSDFTNARDAVDTVDKSLAQMVNNGSADLAAKAFNEIAAAAEAQGVPVEKLAELFDDYQGALGLAGSEQDSVAGSADRLGTALVSTADAADAAADAAKNYNDTLHAMTDPVFGLANALQHLRDAQDKANDATAGPKSQAALDARKRLLDAQRSAQESIADATREYHRVLGDEKHTAQAASDAQRRLTEARADGGRAVTEAQDAYNKAVADHTRGSKTAKDAELDLAAASLDVTTAATTLSAALSDGTTSAEAMAGKLREWTREGLLTKQQAADIADELGIVIDKAQKLDGADVSFKVNADVSAATKNLNKILNVVDDIDRFFSKLDLGFGGGSGGLDLLLSPIPKAQRRAGGGWVTGSGGPRSDRVPLLASPGEFVVNAHDAARNRYALQAMNAGLMPAASRGHTSSGSHQVIVQPVVVPQSVQRIVQVGEVRPVEGEFRTWTRDIEKESRHRRSVER